MNVESHRRAIRESLEEIREAVQKGLVQRQRSVGFHCSVAAVDLLELWLHDQGILGMGSTLKHDWFASVKKAREKIRVDFENKERLLGLLSDLEKKRNILCYGNSQPKPIIEAYVETFNDIKRLLAEMGVEYE